MLSFGLTVSLIGLGSVFIALVLLVFIIWVIGAVSACLEKSSSPAMIGSTQKTAVPERTAVEDEAQRAAAIAAALNAYAESTGGRAPQ